MIGKKYKYNKKDKKIFVLKNIKGIIYEFDCGRWCTDTVFNDLYDCHEKMYNFEKIQLSIF